MSHFPSPHPPLLPSSAAALHQQVQFQSHFHVTTAAPESRALERRKKSTEGPISILDLGLHLQWRETRGAESREVESEAEPTANGEWSASPRPNVK